MALRVGGHTAELVPGVSSPSCFLRSLMSPDRWAGPALPQAGHRHWSGNGIFEAWGLRVALILMKSQFYQFCAKLPVTSPWEFDIV